MSKYTENMFRSLISKLKEIEIIEEFNRDEVIETIRAITEGLVWAEQNHQNFFEYIPLSIFQEQGLMDQYLHYLNQDFDKPIILQLIQVANLLIHNLKSQEHKDYLLNKEFYKEILKHSYDFSDEEIIEHFVSLIKGLAVNLNSTQLKAYLVSTDYNLFTAAMIFFDKSEWLIKTASKTVILQILARNYHTVNEEEIDENIVKSGFFSKILSHYKESVKLVIGTSKVHADKKRLENNIIDSQEYLYYLNDIFLINNSCINKNLQDIILKSFILPFVMSGVIAKKKNPKFFPANVSLYVLSQIIKIIDYRPLIKEIQSILFSSSIRQEYLNELILPEDSDLKNSPNPVSSCIYQYLASTEDNVIGLCLYIIHVSISFSISEFLQATDSLPQKFYESLADKLSKILLVQEQIRYFTIFFASKLLFDLSSTKYKQGSNHNDHDNIKFALQKKMMSLKQIIRNTQRKVEFLRLFEKEWKFTRTLQWLENIEIPINYLIRENDFLSEVPLQYRRSITQDDAIMTEIRVFLLLKKLKHLMIKSEVPEGNDFETCPLDKLEKCQFEVGKDYFLNTGFLKGKNLDEIKMSGQKYIVDDDSFLIIGDKLKSYKSLKIEQVVRFSRIRLAESNDNKTIMCLLDEGNFSFIVEDYFLYTDLKPRIIKRISDCVEADLKYLSSYISDTR